MARRQGKKNNNFRSFEALGSSDRHLRLTQSMMLSKAWGELSCHSITLYVHMKLKFNYKNEDDISFTYAEGKKLMSERTFMKSIEQLIDLGFIKIVRQGWTSREPNIFGFSDQWKHYGTDKFNVVPKRKRPSE